MNDRNRESRTEFRQFKRVEQQKCMLSLAEPSYTYLTAQEATANRNKNEGTKEETKPKSSGGEAK